MRLVPDQDYREVARLFEDYFRSLAPAGVRVEVRYLHGGSPYLSPSHLVGYQAAEEALEQTFGRKPVPFYSGGSIPIISDFEEVLGLKSILMGFGLEEDGIHSPNESYAVRNFERGIETISHFYRIFAEKMKRQ